MQDISQLELDLLFLFYTFSDQYGKVDIEAVRKIAQNKVGVILPNRPFTIQQKHVDVLVKHGILPDVALHLRACASKKPRRRKT